ncbi:MAG: formylglycine-generating enzyme family protein [Pseudomonadota bacterium]
MNDENDLYNSASPTGQIPDLHIPIEVIHKIRSCESDRFDLLAKAAGLDPKRDFRGLDLSSADLTGIDWTEFNFEGSRFIDIPGVTPEMVVVPSGEFMTAPSEVTISRSFAVGRFPVIFDEWDKALDLGFDGPKLKSSFGRGRQPVINVSWEEAKAYADWLASYSGKTYHLLTDAEWEHACRAGSTTFFSFGDDQAELDQYAWYHDNSKGKTHPVGEKKPNAFGLYDMYGNVWEWVNSWHGSYESMPQADPQEPDTVRIRALIGGSWNAGAWSLRSADRRYDTPYYCSDDLGFRLARTL